MAYNIRVISGTAPDGRWVTQISGPFGIILLNTVQEVASYADQLELDCPQLAEVAAMVRRAGDRMKRKGIDA